MWSNQGEGLGGIGVVAGQGVGDDVGAAELVFHLKVEAEQLPNLVVLRDGGQLLIKQGLAWGCSGRYGPQSIASRGTGGNGTRTGPAQ